jgi:hypothetical protein
MASPSGEMGRGPVENVEALRIAMTYSTFREVADLFSQTVGEIQAEDSGKGVGTRRPPLHAMAGPLKN